MCVRNRVLVASEHLAGHQTGEVRHIDKKRRPDIVGDLPHLREVDTAGIGGVAGDKDEWLELTGSFGHFAVVEQSALRVGAVAALVKHLARDVGAEPVRQVTARVQRHAEHALRAELGAKGLPVRLGQVVDVLCAKLLQGRPFDPGGEDRPERDEVCVDPGVWLRVGVRSSEQLACVFCGQRLDRVDVLATGIEAVADGPFGVLVAEPGTHREQHGGGGIVLARDQLQGPSLVGKLLPRRGSDPRLDGGDDVQGGSVRDARCRGQPIRPRVVGVDRRRADGILLAHAAQRNRRIHRRAAVVQTHRMACG